MGNILCSLEPKDWLNVVLAIIGILVSGVGLYIAIRQIVRMRTTSETVQKEVLKSQKQIRQTLDSNEIGRAVKNIEQAIGFVSMGQYDYALTRMMDVKGVIENEDVVGIFLSSGDRSDFDLQKRRFNESFNTISSNAQSPGNIDRRIVQNSLSEIQNYLLKIENKIKASVYERKY